LATIRNTVSQRGQVDFNAWHYYSYDWTTELLLVTVHESESSGFISLYASYMNTPTTANFDLVDHTDQATHYVSGKRLVDPSDHGGEVIQVIIGVYANAASLTDHPAPYSIVGRSARDVTWLGFFFFLLPVVACWFLCVWVGVGGFVVVFSLSLSLSLSVPNLSLSPLQFSHSATATTHNYCRFAFSSLPTTSMGTVFVPTSVLSTQCCPSCRINIGRFIFFFWKSPAFSFFLSLR
jgi:hypothetical protein